MELHIGESFWIDPRYIVTERSAVIGQSGSGKSYLVSVICEELAANSLGFVVVDTEGEYAGLSGHKGIDVIDDVDRIATDEEGIKRIIEESQKIVLDVSEADPKAVNAFLEGIYRVATELFRQGLHKQNPFLIVVEEADIFIPQRGRGLDILQVISRRGRKRGLGVLFATQRPALVNKNVLSQCNNVFIGKLTLKNDIDSVRIFFSSLDDARQLTALEPGNFYVQGAISDPTFVKVRQRETPHGGMTPTIRPQVDSGSELSAKDVVRAPDAAAKSEKLRLRLALDVAKGTKKIRYVPFHEAKVAGALNTNRRKQFKFFGKSESVDDLKLLMLPIFIVSIREIKKRLIGTQFNDYAVLVDGITADILSANGLRRRSRNLSCLLDLSSRQVKLMDFILNNRGVDYARLHEVFPERGIKSRLKKLEERHLISVNDDSYFPLRDITYPKALFSQSADGLALKEGRAEHVIPPRLPRQKLKELIKGLYPSCDVMDMSVVYSPVLEALYTSESSHRRVRIDGLTGKTLRSGK
jgi:hypothetical protein